MVEGENTLKQNVATERRKKFFNGRGVFGSNEGYEELDKVFDQITALENELGEVEREKEEMLERMIKFQNDHFKDSDSSSIADKQSVIEKLYLLFKEWNDVKEKLSDIQKRLNELNIDKSSPEHTRHIAEDNYSYSQYASFIEHSMLATLRQKAKSLVEFCERYQVITFLNQVISQLPQQLITPKE